MLPVTYTPAYLARPGELIISPWSYQSLGEPLAQMIQNNPGSNNWIGVGTVVFVPFYVPEPALVTKLWWLNGSAVAGNIDVGIYDESAARLVSTGSTAQASANATQAVDITDITLARGRYYMAMVSDTSGATQKVRALTTGPGIFQALGCLQQLSVTLPLSTGAAPATFAKYTQAFLPVFGLQCYRAIGP